MSRFLKALFLPLLVVGLSGCPDADINVGLFGSRYEGPVAASIQLVGPGPAGSYEAGAVISPLQFQILDENGDLLVEGPDAEARYLARVSGSASLLKGSAMISPINGLLDYSILGVWVELAGAGYTISIEKEDTRSAGGTGLLVASTGAFDVVPAAADATQSDLSMDQTVVGIGAQVTATLAVKDAYGNQLTSSSGVTVSIDKTYTYLSSGTVTDNGAGIFERIFTGANPGTETVVAAVNGMGVPTSLSVEVVAGGGGATKLVFTSGATDARSDECLIYTVEVQNATNVPVTAHGGKTIALSDDDGLYGDFYAIGDTGCGTGGQNSLVIPDGNASGQFRYRNPSSQSKTLTALSAPLTQAQTTVLLGPNQIAIEGTLASFGEEDCSEITLHVQDSQGTDANANGDVMINLGSSGTGAGAFYSDVNCNTSDTQAIIVDGTTSITVYYQSFAVGSFDITAIDQAASLNSGYRNDGNMLPFCQSGGRDSKTLYNDIGAGTPGNPYVICTVAQFQDLGSSCGATSNGCSDNYLLRADLDFSGPVPLSPIGNVSNNFTGSFDGGSHKLKSLTISLPTTDYVGIFGYLGAAGYVHDLKVESLSIHGNGFVGGLAGRSYGQIENIDATLGASTVMADANYAGGITGQQFNHMTNIFSSVAVNGSSVGGITAIQGGSGKILTNVHSSGTVTGTVYTAGLVGQLQSSAQVRQSSFSGSVSGTSNVGGLVGATGAGSGILESFSTGTVNGNNSVGGLVGFSYNISTIQNSYSTSPVVAISGTAGGLVGSINIGSSAILRNYAIGSVSGATAGGLVGNGDNTPGSYTNNYWNLSTSGQASAIGSGSAAGVSTGQVEGLTTSQMAAQGSFTSWDFFNTWIMVNGRPQLRNNPEPPPVATCGGPAVLDEVHFGGMVLCAYGDGSTTGVNYSGKASLCGSGSHVCSFNEYFTNRNMVPQKMAWIAHTGDYSVSTTGSGGAWSTNSTASWGPVTNTQAAYFCNDGPGGGGGIQGPYCSYHHAGLRSEGTMCCPD